jgi:hypothetical protein
VVVPQNRPITGVPVDPFVAAQREMWRRGAPTLYLLDEGQKAWVERLKLAPPQTTSVWEVARQRGKSFAALAYAVEYALNTPGAIIRYCALTKESALTISSPILAQILADCPPDLRPKPTSLYDENGLPQGKCLKWPNGAELYIFGTDAKSFRKGRGPKTHLQLYDEAAFYQNLPEVEAALNPALQTTGGKALYFSTPPESAGHPFIERCRAARAAGRFVTDTFWNNPRVDHEAIIRGEMERLGLTREQLLASTYFRREYLAEEVVEESVIAMPAWGPMYQPDGSHPLVREHPRPTHYFAHEAFDWGGYENDPHAGLFAYVDFKESKLIIEDEFEARGPGLKQLADAWKAKEKELWGTDQWEGTLLGAGVFQQLGKPLPAYLLKAVSDKAPTQPLLRVCDHDDNLQAELINNHGFAILPAKLTLGETGGYSKHLAVDSANTLIRQGRIIINPRCKRLLEQLNTTIWDPKRTGWVRTAKDHGDLIDCLVYLCRHLQWHRNPFPAYPAQIWQPAKPTSVFAKLGATPIGRRRF